MSCGASLGSSQGPPFTLFSGSLLGPGKGAFQAGKLHAQGSASGELGEGTTPHPCTFPSSPGLACIQLTRVQIQEALKRRWLPRRSLSLESRLQFPSETESHVAEVDLEPLILFPPPLLSCLTLFVCLFACCLLIETGSLYVVLSGLELDM